MDEHLAGDPAHLGQRFFDGPGLGDGLFQPSELFGRER